MQDANLETVELSVEDLQARLADRERLVAELTSRLEQAAEQLDRLKRTGADRPGRWMAAAVPGDLLEQQRLLTEELQQAVQSWEDMQPTALLARLEMQLSEIRDLVIQRPVMESADRHSGAETDSPSPPDDSTEQPAGLSTYEAFKAGLNLEQEAAGEPSAGEGSLAAPADAALQQTLIDIPQVDPPEHVDVEGADLEELRDAVLQRDSYITWLIRKLRAAETAVRPVGHWSDLADVPEKLADLLKTYEGQLEETLRLAEVETSLERARLGREAARLESQKQQIEREITRLGLKSREEDATADDQPAGPRTETKDRRWWQFFQRESPGDEQ